MPTPPADIWSQFPIIAILAITTLLIAGAFYKLWKELLSWQDKQEKARAAERALQDAKRDDEREKQRDWEAAQTKARDLQWQNFLRTQQEQWVANDQRNAAVLARLVARIDDLAVSINNHDTFVRASSGAPDRPAARRKRSDL